MNCSTRPFSREEERGTDEKTILTKLQSPSSGFHGCGVCIIIYIGHVCELLAQSWGTHSTGALQELRSIEPARNPYVQ